jgi:hypothetical protein
MIPEAKRLKIEELAKTAILNHRDAFQTVKDNWLDLYNRYENKLRAGSITSKTKSQTRLGSAYALVENAIPRILAKQPKYRYLARTSKDNDGAKAYDEFSEYQWEQANAQTEIKKIAKWGLITGLAGWSMGWKVEEKIKTKRGKSLVGLKITNPLLIDKADKLGLGKDIKVEERETTQNYTLKAIKPFDLIWNIDAEEIEDIWIIGKRTEIEVKQLAQYGFSVDEYVNKQITTDYWQAKLSEKELSLVSVRQNIENGKISLGEFYLDYQEGDIIESYVLFGAYDEFSEPVFFEVKQNPYDEQFKPIGVWRPVQRPGKMYGFGVIEPAMGIIDSEEDTFNIAVETAWLDLGRPMEYNPQNLLNNDAIAYKPGTLIPVRRLGESVRVMETPVPNMSSTSFITQFLDKAKQNTSGVTVFQTGADQQTGGKTLGEVKIKTAESNARLAMILDSFEKEVLEPVGKIALGMNKQFLASDQKYIYRIVGKKGTVGENSIKFKDIDAVKDVIIYSGQTMLASQDTEIQKWTALLNQAYLEARQPNPVPINKEPIWENLLVNGIQIKDPETYIPSLKEREETEVTTDMAQMQDAKSENANPTTARVLPSDNPKVHIPLHKAEIEARQREIQQTEQQGVDGQEYNDFVMATQMLTQHLNDHINATGGQNPAYTQGMEVGQGLEQEQPQQQQM